ncbi:hypothetical protein PS027_23535, partial [Shigella sonnei]|nr:hypothetical protein [Shigella sonnei]
AFDTRSDCINGTWSEKEDDRGRTIVTNITGICDDGSSSIILFFTPCAIDAITPCIEGTWSEKEDDRGRTIVTYTCDISESGL